MIAPNEIITAISEAIASLATPLKPIIEEEFKAQVVLSKYLPGPEKNIKALTLCPYKAEGCKQIELDFNDALLFTSDKVLHLKFQSIQINLAKCYAISLGNSELYSEPRLSSLLEYKNIIKFLRALFNLKSDYIVKEKSLALLILYLENKVNSVPNKFNENLEALFSYILSLIERQYSPQDEALYVNKLDSLEKTEFFLQLATAIKKVFYEIVYGIDSLILYVSLWDRVNTLAFRRTL